MNKKDLKIGDYWVADYPSHYAIIKCDTNGDSHGQGIDFRKDSKDSSYYRSNSFSGDFIRYANQDEINHLEKCLKAGKYVEPDIATELIYSLF